MPRISERSSDKLCCAAKKTLVNGLIELAMANENANFARERCLISDREGRSGMRGRQGMSASSSRAFTSDIIPNIALANLSNDSVAYFGFFSGGDFEGNLSRARFKCRGDVACRVWQVRQKGVTGFDLEETG